MAAADARHDKETANKLTAMSVQLNAALEQLLKLAHCLDASALPPETETDIKQLLTAACAHIVNGQGDLFADQ
jgi:ferritin-like protein